MLIKQKLMIMIFTLALLNIAMIESIVELFLKIELL
jgi:hypothetical protein